MKKRMKHERVIDGEEMRLRGYYGLLTDDELKRMKKKVEEKYSFWKEKTLKEYLRYLGALQ